jgi:opacity protein-like surface antigen
MRAIFMTLFCFIVCAADASAQSAVTAGKVRSVDVSLGYSFVSQTSSQSTRVGSNGVDANVTLGLNAHLAVRGDFGYARSANLLGAPSHSSVLSYLAGPVFYPATHGNFDTYVHALLGGARVSGPVPTNGGILIGGWATGFAWAVGGGVDYRVSNSFALRAGVDYLRTGYFSPSLTIQGQNNIRATGGVVYMFGAQRGKRR